MTQLNPEIFRWARETAGLTLEQAAQKLGIGPARGLEAPDRLAAIESGENPPTRPQLEKMANIYRRPLLIFYLPGIPPQGSRGKDFRKLSVTISPTDDGFVDAVVRDISVRQTLVKASIEAAGEVRPLSFIRSMSHGQGVRATAASIEETLGFSRETFRSKPHSKESFAYLRGLAGKCGIFILLIDNLGSWHSKINLESFRGFAIADNVAPFVAVNANDSPNAWSFTLIHELAHLWIGETGISGGRYRFSIEKFCNDVASEILLPADEIATIVITKDTPFDDAIAQIDNFARPRKVSRTMVAYRLHLAGSYDFNHFQRFEEHYRKTFANYREREKIRNAEKDGGPNYFIVRRHRVGEPLIRFVEQMMHDGYLSTTKAAKTLGVGAHNVHRLLENERLRT